MNPRQFRLEDLARLVQGEYVGQSDLTLEGLASLDVAQAKHIAFVNAEKYWRFVMNGINYFSNDDNFKAKLKDGKVHLFMDNAAIHYKRDIRAEYLDLNVKVIYNVAYCCHLNPIEYCFSRLKSHLRSKVIKTQDSLIDIVEEYFKTNVLVPLEENNAN